MIRPAVPRTLAILAFHKIGEPPPGAWPTWFYVSETRFVEYLRCLQDGGWEVVDAAALTRAVVAPENLPPCAALLTFDDGYRSLRDVALPWLRRFDYPAVAFVPTDYIGGHNVFDDDEPQERICDWDDLQALQAAGISVQSHGASHRPFSSLDAAEQRAEVERSKRLLESGLGTRVEIFCYPYGDPGTDAESVQAVLQRAGYQAACLYDGFVNRLPIVDPYLVHRLAMGPDTDLTAELAGLALPIEEQPR